MSVHAAHRGQGTGLCPALEMWGFAGTMESFLSDSHGVSFQTARFYFPVKEDPSCLEVSVLRIE